MGYPVGPLLQTLAEHILANLEDITDRAPKGDDADWDASAQGWISWHFSTASSVSPCPAVHSPR
jgi:hypothetical protein